MKKQQKKSCDHEKCKQTSKDNTNDHQVALKMAWEFQVQWTMPNLADQRIRRKANLEAAKKIGRISIVCRALWQNVVHTCRQQHACQSVQVAQLFQNLKLNWHNITLSNISARTNQLYWKNNKGSCDHEKNVNKRARTTQTTVRSHLGRPENFKFKEQCQT